MGFGVTKKEINIDTSTNYNNIRFDHWIKTPLLSPRTTKLFRLTFATKKGLFQPPWILVFRPNFFVKFFTGIVSGSRNPMVIVKSFYLYHMTLKLKVIDLVHGCGATLWPSLSRSWSGSTGFIHRFSNSLTQKHRYRHQDYISRMSLAKDTKNNENLALGPFNFCAARGRGTWETKWQNLSFGFSCALETFCEKHPGKSYRGKTTEGCSNPLGCIRVNQIKWRLKIGARVIMKNVWIHRNVISE